MTILFKGRINGVLEKQNGLGNDLRWSLNVLVGIEVRYQYHLSFKSEDFLVVFGQEKSQTFHYYYWNGFG